MSGSMKAKMFIPCIIGRCPERMQLVVRDSRGWWLHQPYYRCMRREGPTPCLCSDDDYAREHCVAGVNINADRWVRNENDKRRSSGEPTREEMETMI